MRVNMKYVDRLAAGLQCIENGDRYAMITTEGENLRALRENGEREVRLEAIQAAAEKRKTKGPELAEGLSA